MGVGLVRSGQEGSKHIEARGREVTWGGGD